MESVERTTYIITTEIDTVVPEILTYQDSVKVTLIRN